MRSKYLFIGIIACLIGVVAILMFARNGWLWWIYLVAGVGLLLLLLLWRSVIMPSRKVVQGIDLIKAQDFNNHLIPVHEAEADKIVHLFNHIIDKLRNERIHNREQEGFLNLLIEASPMGVVILDFDDKVSLVNASFLRIVGIRHKDEVLGKKIHELPSVLARRMASVALGKCHVIRRGDVKTFRCYHLNFLQMGFQRHFYMLESLTEEVMKAERTAYEKIIRIISHEVNNTMGGVRSVLDTIYGICDDNDIKEVIESCDNRCNEMCKFINSYADVIKVPHPILQETELNREIKKMIPFLMNLVPDNVELSVSLDEDELKVNIDRALIQQVIVNIVKNAVESISDSGHIELIVSRDRNSPSLTIANDGEPISEDVAKNLFSPFFTTKREGRGVGLTLISEILNRHKAQFSLTTGDDMITRFHIRF